MNETVQKQKIRRTIHSVEVALVIFNHNLTDHKLRWMGRGFKKFSDGNSGEKYNEVLIRYNVMHNHDLYVQIQIVRGKNFKFFF